MPVPKTGGLPLADVPSTQNYTDGERDLETAFADGDGGPADS